MASKFRIKCTLRGCTTQATTYNYTSHHESSGYNSVTSSAAGSITSAQIKAGVTNVQIIAGVTRLHGCGMHGFRVTSKRWMLLRMDGCLHGFAHTFRCFDVNERPWPYSNSAASSVPSSQQLGKVQHAGVTLQTLATQHSSRQQSQVGLVCALHTPISAHICTQQLMARAKHQGKAAAPAIVMLALQLCLQAHVLAYKHVNLKVNLCLQLNSVS